MDSSQGFVNGNQTSRAEWDRVVMATALQIRQSLDLPTILQTTADEVQRLLGGDRALVYQFEADWSGRVVVEAISEPQYSLLDKVVRDTCFEAGWLQPYQDKHVVAIADIETADLSACHRTFLTSLQIKANLVVPIFCGTTLWGLLLAQHCTAPREWQGTEIQGLQQIAVQVGIAIQQADLMAELQAAKAQLEAQVEDRTEALAQTHQALVHTQAQCNTVMDSLQFLRQVLDSLFTFVGVLTPAGILLEANQAPLEIAGLTREDVIGRPFANAYWWSYAIEAQDQIRAAIARAGKGESVRFDIPVQIQGGQLIIIDFSLNPLRNEWGEITHLIPSGIDITERKQANQQIRHLAALVESSQDAIISHTPEGIITSWNAAAERLLGYTAQTMIGQPITNILPPDRLQESTTILQRIHRGEPVETYATQRQHQQGPLINVALTISPIYDEGGSVIGASKILRDISQQQKAEMALRRSEARYRNIIETTLEGVWVLDNNGQTTFVNQRMAEMAGYTSTEMIGKHWLDFIAPAEHPQARTYLQGRQQGLEEQRTLQLQRRDGAPLWAMVSATPLYDDHGQWEGMISLLTDITTLVRTQEALQNSEMQLSGILNNSPDGIMAFRSVRDKQNKIIDFEWLLSNPKACQTVGRSPEDLIGYRLLEELPGHLQSGLFDTYVRVVETGEPCHREFYYEHDGFESWFENVSVKLGDGFAVTFRDITEMKQSEFAIQQVNQQLEQRIADLDQRHGEMLVLNEISDFLQACLTVNEACAAFKNLVPPLFPDCAGGLFISNASRNRVALVSSWGGLLPSATDFSLQGCWALRRGRLHSCQYEQDGLRCQHSLEGEDIYATLCVPMIAQGETFGLFYLTASTSLALSEAKRQLARTVAEQVAMAIANLILRETLQQQSIRDGLTGLFNRRYLEEFLTQEISRAQRKHHRIGVIMLDVDHFKRFNDTYGHDAGDYVLKIVALKLKESVRSSDTVCRYGGEEFTIILPESDLQDTQRRAEEIRQVIAGLVLTHSNQFLGQLTISLGVAGFPEQGATDSALLKAADEALFRAKQAGRNRVISSQKIAD